MCGVVELTAAVIDLELDYGVRTDRRIIIISATIQNKTMGLD